MRANQAFDGSLQIQVEGGGYCAAQFWFSCHDCINEVRCKTSGIRVHHFRWRYEQRLLIGWDNSQLNQPGKRPTVLQVCSLRMSPWIESRRCLRQTGKKNC